MCTVHDSTDLNMFTFLFCLSGLDLGEGRGGDASGESPMAFDFCETGGSRHIGRPNTMRRVSLRRGS